MPDDANPRAVIGGNFPPAELADTTIWGLDAVRARIDAEDSAAFERLTELEIGATQKIPPVITTKEVAERAVSQVRQMREALDEFLAIHRRLKAPYAAVIKFLDDRYLRRRDTYNLVVGSVTAREKVFWAKLAAEQRAAQAAARHQAAIAAHRAAEERERLARLARQQENDGNRRAAVRLARQSEQAAAEAAHQQALAAMPDQPVTIHGEYGATGFAVKKWKFAVADPEALPRQYWKPDEEAIRAELDAAIAEGGKPPAIAGVEFYCDEQFRIRRC
jgi:hypothetical protein